MIQPSLLDPVPPDADTYTGRVARLFLSQPGVWIDGMEIARHAGCYGWRTRISECRTVLGLQVENRQRRIGRRVISEYRLKLEPKRRIRSTVSRSESCR